MIQAAAGFLLAAVLLVAAGSKLARPRESAAANSVYGADAPVARWTIWAAAVLAELALAAGVAARSDTAAYLAAAMMVLFALMMVGAILRGRAGRSCACFGARSRLGWPAVGRNLALAVGFAALPQLPGGALSTEQWLGLGLGAALLGVAALGAAVLALAREIGDLRLRMPPAGDSALEIPEEGPPLGSRIDPAALGSWFGFADTKVLLAVFMSEGCHICRALEPSVTAFMRDPVLAGRIFDEAADAEAWSRFEVPGSPYAAALGPDGAVLAKGSFNTVAQLESVLAAAERRSGPLFFERGQR